MRRPAAPAEGGRAAAADEGGGLSHDSALADNHRTEGDRKAGHGME